MFYHPPQKIIQKYADVLVNYALNSGKGIKPGEVVYLQVSESAKPLYVALRNAVLEAGGTFITNYMPDDIAREYFEIANDQQLSTYHQHFYTGLVKQMDHSIYIISETNLKELEGIDPKKIMLRSKTMRPYKNLRDQKENAGKFTWTLALYGTPAMAKEAGMTQKAYWSQIIKACFLDKIDPKEEWRKAASEIERLRTKLNELEIEKLQINGEGINLTVGVGPHRQWLGGTGRNIPSFELFISPDWRQTQGEIYFNQPLYRYGSLIKGIRLEFKDGIVTKASAKNNEKLLLEMLKTDEGSDKIGEFSLTDSRLSRITKFMAETLFDENIGGKYGNAHVAIGSAYKDSFPGNPDKVTKAQWEKFGYNDSVVHTDIISTANKTVIAQLKDGSKLEIYKDGKFTI